MKIRRIKHDEIHFLSEMLYLAIFIPEGHEALPKEVIKDKSLSKYIENWGKDKYDIVMVAETDGHLAGAIWGRLLTSENKGFGYIDSHTPELGMAIKPEYRNKGIGTDLMKAIIKEYRNTGVDYLSLSVDKANKASNLYKRFGFEVAEETATSQTMSKRISPKS